MFLQYGDFLVHQNVPFSHFCLFPVLIEGALIQLAEYYSVDIMRALWQCVSKCVCVCVCKCVCHQCLQISWKWLILLFPVVLPKTTSDTFTKASESISLSPHPLMLISGIIWHMESESYNDTSECFSPRNWVSAVELLGILMRVLSESKSLTWGGEVEQRHRSSRGWGRGHHLPACHVERGNVTEYLLHHSSPSST